MTSPVVMAGIRRSFSIKNARMIRMAFRRCTLTVLGEMPILPAVSSRLKPFSLKSSKACRCAGVSRSNASSNSFSASEESSLVSAVSTFASGSSLSSDCLLELNLARSRNTLKHLLRVRMNNQDEKLWMDGSSSLFCQT